MNKPLVAFDLYGTLLSTESISKELAGHFGKEKAKSIAAVWRKYQLEYTWRLNSMSRRINRMSSEKMWLMVEEQYQPFSNVTRSSLQHALAEHAVSLEEADIESLMQAYDSLSTFPDVEPALKELSSNEHVSCVVFCRCHPKQHSGHPRFLRMLQLPRLTPHNSQWNYRDGLELSVQVQ